MQYKINDNFGKIDASQLKSGTSSNSGINVSNLTIAGVRDNPLLRPAIGADIGPDPRNAQCRFMLPRIPTQDAINGVKFDFNGGYRMYFPKGTDYIFRVVDMNSGLELFKQRFTGEVMHTSEAKYCWPYRLELLDPTTEKLLFEHEFNPEGKRVNIIVPDGGLGDNVAWVPYPEEFRKKYKAEVYCAIGEWMERLVKDSYPELHFCRFEDLGPDDDSYASFFCAIFRSDRNSWRPIAHQFLGMQKSVANILGLEIAEVMPKFDLSAPRRIKEPYVCISAQATNPCKYWNFPGGWDEVIAHLKSIGYRVLCIDRERELIHKGNKYCKPEGAEDVTGCLPIQKRIDLLMHADFFIGLPSGLSWLAWASKIPVVMISGFTLDPCEFYTPYRVTNYQYCHGCWNYTDVFFDGSMPEWCPRHLGTPRQFECTKNITPKMVMAEIVKVPQYQERLRKHQAEETKAAKPATEDKEAANAKNKVKKAKK